MRVSSHHIMTLKHLKLQLQTIGNFLALQLCGCTGIGGTRNRHRYHFKANDTVLPFGMIMADSASLSAVEASKEEHGRNHHANGCPIEGTCSHRVPPASNTLLRSIRPWRRPHRLDTLRCIDPCSRFLFDPSTEKD